MKLDLLLPTKKNLPEIEVAGITADSRLVKNGFVFFALKGEKIDGHEFIESAIKNGASVIIGEQDLSILGYVKSDNTRRDLAIAATKFYYAKPKNIAAVTGTNGKTSVADFTRQLLEMAKLDSASIGTLGFIHHNKTTKFVADNTTPDPITLNQLLTQVKDCAVIEASSIGLAQHRLEGIKISAAAFTNFTQDHLDYHGTMQKYFAAKAILFSEVMQKGVAVLNTDIPQFAELKKICKSHKILSYGKMGELKLLFTKPEHDGQIITLEILGKKYEIKTPLIGSFQAENILCALGLAHATGTALEKLMEFIPHLKPVEGRMGQPASGVYIDYAHTPDALQNALSALRPHTQGKIITVFGCGGDRDKSKRPQMGKIAANLSDIAIVTDDNPRTENAAQIRAEVIAASPKLLEIGDREKAISQALKLKQKNDIVLIAGKGHEKYQIYGTEKQYFDDAEIVKRYS